MGIMTVEDVARELKVSIDDVNLLIQSGVLKSINIGNNIRISENALNDFIASSEGVDNSPNTPTAVDKPDEGTVSLQEKNCNGRKKKVRVYFTKPKSGGLIAQIDVGHSADGKRVMKSHRVKNEQEGYTWAEGIIEEYNLATHGPSQTKPLLEDSMYLGKNPTLRSYLEAFLHDGFGHGTTRTRKGYYDCARQIIDEIGHFKLRELTFFVVKKMFDKFSLTYSQSTINKQFIVLDKAMQKAKILGYINTDIFSGFYDEYGKHNNDYPYSQKTPKKVTGYTDDELKLIFDEAIKYQEVYPILLLFYETGIRPGELRGLKWNKIDWDNKKVSIDCRIVSEYGKLDIDSTNYSNKNECLKDGVKNSRANNHCLNEGIRELPISDKMIGALKDWRVYVQGNSDFEYFKDSEFVFATRTSAFITESALKSKMDRFAKSSGIKDKIKSFSMYRFRHTYCTRLALARIPTSVTMKMMGDRTSGIVMNVYTNIERSTAIEITRSVIEEGI